MPLAAATTLGVGSVAWGLTLVGWAVSPYISRRINEYLDATGSSANNLQSLEDKIQHLKRILEAARLSSEDDQKLVEEWAKKLKSAFYDAEDIMDAIDYHRLKWNATSHRQSINTTNQVTTEKDFTFPPGSSDKLKETLEKIEKLNDEGEKLVESLRLTTSGYNMKSSREQTTGSGSLSETTSEPQYEVFGRDEDAEKIRSMLHDTAAEHSVVAIHGISGSGKTTLVQYVCEREKNSGVPYFEVIMWIHVTQNFRVHTVYKKMLEIVLGPQKDKFSHLGTMQDKLKKELKDKRLLLVLDDVWYSESVDKQNDLKKLLSPLKEADKASRVLVTSRNADAAKLLGAQNPMPISDMNEEEFLKMFMYYALDKSQIKHQDKGKFETIGREISQLLRNSPLAVRTVVGQLRIRTHRAEDIGFWIDTLNRKSDLLKDTMGALWWSYLQLDEHVRQCFAYCSIFPRRYELERDELVRMWMAQGFVDTSKNSDMEVAARECFEVLLSTSFIQLKGETSDKEYYTVHDLLHDLAETVSGSDSFIIENDMVDPMEIPQDVRHLFISSENLGELMEQIVKLDSLRTLVMHYAKEITVKEFKRILKDLKKLRFVDVCLKQLQENVIPGCIGELKHLGYLGLHVLYDIEYFYYYTIKLPLEFTKLYHLQELVLPSLTIVHCPHNEMANLENLRRIEGHFTVPDIGRMTWLQTLGGHYTVKKEKGYEITQLEKLNSIRGELCINGLENIPSKDDARRANLSNKLNVTNLSFDWKINEDEETGSSSRKKQKTTADDHQQVVTPEPEEILEALQPPALLGGIAIRNYGRSTFPSWLSGEDGKLKHLRSLYFSDCHGSGSQFKFSKALPELYILCISQCSWNSLPDNIEQLVSLGYLSIWRCRNIQSLPELPSSLKILQTVDCPNIKALPELPPSLEELIINCCENIQSPPRLPSSLQKLGIEGCLNISTLLELPPSSLEELIIYGFENIRPPPRLPSFLKKLQIKGCPNIKILLELPLSLEELEIKDCQNILSPPRLPSSLKKLQIKYCPNVKTLLELPSSLEKLQIKDCLNIQSLPGLPSSLKKLCIKGCPNITSLPELPPSIEELLWP